MPAARNANLEHQRKTVDAFLAALRAGDFKALLEVLDPDVVVRVDEAGARAGAPREVRGATEWAKQAVAFSRHARFMQPAMVDGEVGAVWAPGGRLVRVLRFRFVGGQIAGIDVITTPADLADLELSVLEG
jgi:RNA polymerase sigma-70 factor (ECF subfamily)